MTFQFTKAGKCAEVLAFAIPPNNFEKSKEESEVSFFSEINCNFAGIT